MKKNLLKLKKYDCGISLKIGYLLLGTLFFPTFFSSFLMIFGISTLKIEFFIGILFLLISYYFMFYNPHKDKKSFYLPIVISLLIVSVSVLCCFIFYDNSWDGLAYHLPAVIKLKNGWNPIYQHYDDETIIGMWAEHYPKFIWIYSSLLYKVTNNLFVGNSFNIILAFATGFICYNNIKKEKNKLVYIIISALIPLNAIAIGQFFTMYNDGVLGTSIIAVIFMYRFLIKNNYNFLNSINPYVIIITMYLSLLVNIKYTGALFAFIIFLLFTIICIIKKMLIINKKILIYFGIIGIGVMTIALNTYLPNIIYHHNFGYPIIGENKIDIITPFIPNYVKDEGKIKAFIKSFTTDSSYETYDYNPFYIIKKEDIVCSSSNDCRKNGFGPFFQSIIILITMVVIIEIIKIIFDIIKGRLTFRKFISENIIDIIIICVLGIFFFITPATWWSRYIPYVYLIPIFIIIHLNIEWGKNNVVTFLSCVVILLYCLTSVILLKNRVYNSFLSTKEYKNQVNALISEHSNKGKLKFVSLDDTCYYMETVTNEILNNNSISFEREKNNNDENCIITKSFSKLNVGILECENIEN